MALKPVLVTPPAASIITLAEAKAHLRIDHTDEDTLVAALLAAVASHLDGYSGVLGRALITQTWQQSWPDFGDGSRVLGLSVAPAIAVSWVKYYDAAGVQQTVSPSSYTLLTDALGAYVGPTANATWPTSLLASDDAVTVQYTAGYGATSADIPAAIRAAALLLVGHWYANREAVITDERPPSMLPMAVDALLMPFRRVSL